MDRYGWEAILLAENLENSSSLNYCNILSGKGGVTRATLLGCNILGGTVHLSSLPSWASTGASWACPACLLFLFPSICTGTCSAPASVAQCLSLDGCWFH